MTTEIMKQEIGEIRLVANGMEIQKVSQVFGFAELMQRANMLPKGVTTEGAVVSIIAGARLGLDPFQSVQGIASINGRPSLWGDAMVAVVKASGLLEDEKVEYLPSHKDCQGVRVTVKRKNIETPYIGEFSKSMAEKAGLWGKDGTWAKYPDRMMMNRARAFAYRDAFADVLRGMRCAEEELDIETVKEVTTTTQPPQKPRKRASAAEVIDVEAVQPAEAQAAVEDAEPIIPIPE